MTCPFCNSEKNRKIVTTPTWSIVACSNCTNAWTNPAPSAPDYSQEDFHSQFDYHKLPWQWRKSLDMQVKLIKKHLKKDGHILEIGCGQGLLLKLLKKESYNVTGLEPSIAASSTARSSGLNVITGEFPQDIPTNTEYDLIIMSHVLEHLENPLEVIKEIRKITKKDGKLLLIQTNYKGLVPKRYKEKWYAWVPEHHFWHFSPEGLQLILKKQGYHTLQNEYSSLVHGSLISYLPLIIPKTGDQFHLMAEIVGGK